MLTFWFSKADGEMTEKETLTAGMVGKEVRLEFSEDWKDFSKTAVFTANEKSWDVVVSGDVVTIPHEVLEEDGHYLYVAVYGAAADGRVIPTIRVRGPKICPGADPSGDESVEESLPVWAQLEVEIDALQEGLNGKLPQTAEAAAGQILTVAAVNGDGTVREVRAVDAPAAYELPVGGTELGGIKNGGNVVIRADGTMEAPETAMSDEEIRQMVSNYVEEAPTGGFYVPTVSQPVENALVFEFQASKSTMPGLPPSIIKLPDSSGVTDEQLAAAVSAWMEENPDATTTVQDGAISTEKLADNAVTPEKLAGIDCVERLVPWELFYDGMNTNTSRLYPDENSAIFVLHLEKGKTYCTVADPYPAPVNRMPVPQYTDNTATHGYYVAYSAPLSAEMLEGATYIPGANQISYGGDHKILKAMHTGGYCTDTSDYDFSNATASGYFTMLEDVWLYRAALKPTEGMLLESRRFFETDPGYMGTGFGANLSDGIGRVYKFDLGTGANMDPAITLSSALMAVESKNENDRIYASMSRDVPRDRSLRIMFIGDSITFAASVGAGNMFRKFVSMNLNAPFNTICQSGVSVTTGSGSYDWNNQTGDAYDSGGSGYAGLFGKMPQAANSFRDKVIAEGTDLIIVELGTNDFWNDAPLGSVSDLTDDATFYGAVEKTITLLENTFPNAQIMWVLPFKNERWTVTNGAGCTLVDYLIALKILCQMHQRVWVLDLFDKWYLDYDNESIRRKFFIDGVHITGDAHKCVAEAMIDKIRQLFSVVGLKRIEQPVWYASNDSRYGTA